MAETLRPLFDRVLVKRETPPETTEHGLFAGNAKEQPNRGRVLSIGPGLPLESGEVRPMSVNEGDLVLFGKYDGQEIKINNEDGYIVFAEREIIAVIEEA